MKKLLALLLALVLCMGILAGCGPAGGGDETVGGNVNVNTNNDGPLFDAADNVSIEIWLPNNADLEWEGNYLNQAINKFNNMTLTLKEFDERSQYDTTMAEQKVPQLSALNTLDIITEYGAQGAYINWMEYLDQMPNVAAMLEDERWAEDVAKYTYSENVMYGLPMLSTKYPSVWGYLYRQDIFDANGLTFPTTQEEFYNTLVKLKELYPSSYPFVIRQMKGNMQGLQNFAISWGTHHVLTGEYNSVLKFDPKTEGYYFAQSSDTMREILVFLNKLYKEGLLHPSCMSMDTAMWSEALATNMSFITFDKMDRIMALTNGAIDANPNYVLMGTAPIAMGSNGVAESMQQGPAGYSLAASSLMDADQLSKVLAFVDWLYSPKGIEVTNWGLEGESFEVDAEGNKVFKEDFQYESSGLGVIGVCAYRDFEIYKTSLKEHVVKAIEDVTPHAVSPHDPILVYTEDEQYVMDTYAQALMNSAAGWMQKFILGKGADPASDADWDAYVKEMEALHIDDLKEIHEAAYARYKG